MQRVINGLEIMIVNGTIHVDGKHVGRVDHDYKHGYHPCICLALEGHEEIWIEIDTPNRLDVIFNKIADAFTTQEIAK